MRQGTSHRRRRTASAPCSPPTRSRLLVLLPTLCLLLLAAGSCTSDPDPGAEPSGSSGEEAEREPADVVVVVDVYSGRPNPNLTLAQAEADELAALLEGLVEASEPFAGPDDAPLGFRRFIVQLSSDDGSAVYWIEPTAVYRVRGLSTIEDLLGIGDPGDIQLTPLVDGAGETYSLLYELASDQLDPETLEAIPQPPPPQDR